MKNVIKMFSEFARKTVLMAGILVSLNSFAQSQTDHINLEEGLPTQLEDAYPTAKRNREFQLVTRYERTDDGKDRVTLSPRVEFSFWRNSQMKVTAPFYTGSADKTNSGDVEVELFYNFNTEGLRLPAFAVSGKVTAPSGRKSAGLDTAVKFIMTKSVSNRLDRIHLNLQFQHNAGRRFDERSTLYQAIIGYSGRIGPDTIFVADFVREQERKRGENSNIIELGIRRQLNPLTVISIGVGAGIGEESPKFRISIGIQRSLTFLRF